MIIFVNTIATEIVNHSASCRETLNCAIATRALAFLIKIFVIRMVPVSVNHDLKENSVLYVKMVSILIRPVAIVNIAIVHSVEVCPEAALLVVYVLVNLVGPDPNAKSKPNNLKTVTHVLR